ncbi:two pore calcium channel protein 1-like [Octopus sinensis]|uniref:Two pore calcium channel protein 1-like n=1 Tax=Octopus sinensis TaxID=2607531 RepID=A0A6P7SC92_9MOLL|nr:two pore calcium channel protein 1-like [Octopus sinensis]XP_036358494.1 two pore calcium channel protein 1-like [Octopus sinensis]
MTDLRRQMEEEDSVTSGQSVMDIPLDDANPVKFDVPDQSKRQEDDFLVAATLINDAKYARNMNFRRSCVRSYIFYSRWHQRGLLYLALALNLALCIFEKPAVPGFELPFWATSLLELVCLVIFLIRIIHTAYFDEMEKFWRDTKHIVLIVILVLTIIDMFSYSMWITFAPVGAVRWSRSLRPFLIVNFPEGRQVRQAFRNIRRALPEVFNIFVLFSLTLCLFSLLALKLYAHRHLHFPDGTPYFTNYIESIWQLYVLVTTANNPDVMMPAYDFSNWEALFFIIVLLVLLYIFMSIVLAAIYNSYRDNLKNEVKDVVYGKRQRLKRAFEILKVTQNGQFVITKVQWMKLMTYVLPKRSVQQHELLLKVLDTDKDGTIKMNQFLKVADLLQLPLTEVKDRMSFMETHCATMYNSYISNVIKVAVRHRFFRWFFDALIFVNAWIIGFDIDEADWFFLSIFMFEILLKLYVFGVKKFFRLFWNIFDFFVIIGALCFTIYDFIESEEQNNSYILDLFLVMRVLRLFKTFANIKRFRLVIMTIVNIAPSMTTYGMIMLIFYYTFAIIGMEIFHGLIRFHSYNETYTEQNNLSFCGNIKLKNSDFYYEHYCSNNFNHIFKSMVILVELTVVNQWHILSSGFVLVTNKFARLYFLAFHICCVVIILNIFIAFVIEAFILEYTLSKQRKRETDIEVTIKELGYKTGVYQPSKKKKPSKSSDKESFADKEEEGAASENTDSGSDTNSIEDVSLQKGFRFHLKKHGRKSMRIILQQMFEEEINESTGRKITLDSVM